MTARLQAYTTVFTVTLACSKDLAFNRVCNYYCYRNTLRKEVHIWLFNRSRLNCMLDIGFLNGQVFNSPLNCVSFPMKGER